VLVFEQIFLHNQIHTLFSTSSILFISGTIAIKSANINKGGKITSHPIVKADLEIG
jgi:hypothetical protein